MIPADYENLEREDILAALDYAAGQVPGRSPGSSRLSGTTWKPMWNATSGRSNLYFRRDPKGNEVDLLVESGPDVVAVEIKAGATITGDYFKGLRTFAARLGSPPKASVPIYGGFERQRRSDVTVWRAGDVAAMMNQVG